MTNRTVETLDLSDLGEPSTLRPTNDAEELAAMLTPNQWPLRPPKAPVHMLPLVRKTVLLDEGGWTNDIELATLLAISGEYYLVQKSMYELTGADLRKESMTTADPAQLFDAGWRGD